MVALSHTVQLRQRLTSLIEQGNAEGLLEALSTLRNADFRVASQFLGQGDAWRAVDEPQFWHFFRILARANAKAFVGTLIKAAVCKHKRQTLTFVAPDLRTFVQEEASVIDVRKMAEAFLPLMDSLEGAQQLLQTLLRAEDTAKTCVMHLFRAATAPCYFLLFRTLKQLEEEVDYLRRIAVELMRRGDKMAFNLAAIVKTYFDLDALPGTFSLQLPAYELSRLDKDYAAFLKILQR